MHKICTVSYEVNQKTITRKLLNAFITHTLLKDPSLVRPAT